MAHYFSATYAAGLLNYLYDTSEAAVARPSDVRLSLHTGTPGSSGGFLLEASTASWTDYAPIAINNDGSTTQPVFNAAVAGGSGYRIDQLGDLVFSTAASMSASTVTVTLSHYALADHTTTGGRTMIQYGTLFANFVVSDGELVRVATGAVDIDLPTS